MTNFTSEEEFSALLRQAEPEIPTVDSQTILQAMRQGNAAKSMSSKHSAGSFAAGTHRLLAVAASVVAVVLVIVAMPNTLTTAAPTLAEFRASKKESDIVSDQLKRLNAIDQKLLRQISVTDIRASESLWMLVLEYELNASSQRQQAEVLVSLYSNTPAAERCRRIFPDL